MLEVSIRLQWPKSDVEGPGPLPQANHNVLVHVLLELARTTKLGQIPQELGLILSGCQCQGLQCWSVHMAPGGLVWLGGLLQVDEDCLMPQHLFALVVAEVSASPASV